MYTSIDELQQAVTGVLRLDGNTLRVTDEQTLREKIIDDLVFTAMFAADQALQAKARSLIRQLAEAPGIRSSSLHHYYPAIGKGEVPTTSTVPAIKEGYSGPVFLQGDHAQVNARRYREDPAAETLQMKRLIQETIDADFHNIDIDASTLVDLSKVTLDEQQAENYRVTAAFTDYIRSLETS